MNELEQKIQEWNSLGYTVVQDNETINGLEYIHIASYDTNGDPIYENWWNINSGSFHF